MALAVQHIFWNNRWTFSKIFCLHTKMNEFMNNKKWIPFRFINKLVTRRNASRGDLLKNFGGVMLGGSVVGFRAHPPASQARIDPWCNLSKCSVDAVDLVWRCLGYHPRAGRPEILSISPFACRAWLILRWCCGRPLLPSVVWPEIIFVTVWKKKQVTQPSNLRSKRVKEAPTTNKN